MAPRRIRQRPEQIAQIAVVNFLRVALPRRAVFWHTPNGGKRSKTEAGIFKALGVLAGFPDIAIWLGGKLYLAEMKAPGRSTSLAQDDCIVRLVDEGAIDLGVWDCVEDCECSLLNYRIPLRASVFGKGVATSAGSRRAA